MFEINISSKKEKYASQSANAGEEEKCSRRKAALNPITQEADSASTTTDCNRLARPENTGRYANGLSREACQEGLRKQGEMRRNRKDD